MNQTAFIDDTQTYREATQAVQDAQIREYREARAEPVAYTAYRIETEGGHRRITDGINNTIQWHNHNSPFTSWTGHNINRRRQYVMTRTHNEEDSSLLLSCSYNGMTYHQRISQQELFTIQHGIGQEALVKRYEEHLRDKMDNYLKQLEWDNYTVNITNKDWQQMKNRIEELETQISQLLTINKINVETFNI